MSSLRMRPCPPPPKPPFFDASQNAWVLSRYGDVLAALREHRLRQAGPQTAPIRVREDVLASFSPSMISAWREQTEPLAYRIIEKLPSNRPVDLVSDVLRPWSFAVTAIVLGLDPAVVRRLAALEPRVSGDNADANASCRSRRSLRGVWLGVRRRFANARLEKILLGVHVPGAQSLCLGLSQTLPDFVANAWLALLENPSQLLRLHADPNLAPRAIEELLRYCGPVHTLSREADQAVIVAGVKVAEGERVILKVASANRDPEQFPDPNALDIARGTSGHLALGGGPHSCVGALLVRMAATQAIRAFAEKLAEAEMSDPVVWRCGSTLCSPETLRVWRANSQVTRSEEAS